MEYSPMMVLMLWALTPSDCLPTEGGNSAAEQARVVEMPQPIMSVHPEAYFTFNHGRPFLAERDPLTGAIDSNIKTTPVSGDDYFYEEYEESGETIDRKDGSSKIFTRNDITSTAKDSELHKFLNLPVHYSSSGKFPLISSSYANTKVQGHGPLSNHKLYSSSTSTTTTVSPSYYTHKTKTTTTTEKLSTTTKATTTTPITTTTPAPTTQRTTITSTTPKPPPPPSSTTITTATKPPRTTVTTTTTTMKPLLSNYDYEYEYDYDKNDGEDAENSSHDYEFLGSSSEVTSSYEKNSTTTNPLKQPTSETTHSQTTEKSTTTRYSSTEPSQSTTTKKVEPLVNEQTSRPPNLPSKTEKPFEHSSIKYEEDTYDLKPPKTHLVPSVELKPPQFHPTRPFSSVVPNKPQSYTPSAFVRYPETPLMFGDKKPFTVYSPHNVTKPQSAINPTVSQLSADKKQQEEKQTSSTPQAVHLVQKKPSNEHSTEPNEITTTTMAQSHESAETVSEKISETNTPMHQNNKEISDVSEKPTADKSQINRQSSTERPHENHKVPYGVIIRPESGPETDYKSPPTTVQPNKHEDLIADNKKHQEGPVRPHEYRPQGTYEVHHNFQGMNPSGSNRPLQDHRIQQPPQFHYKPTSSVYDINSAQGIPQSHRPQDSIPDHTRLPINVKPDPNRPHSPTAHLPPNKPFIHLPTEHNKPPNYHWLEYNRPPSNFGLRITERPVVPDRIPNVDHRRPAGKPQITQAGNGLEVRPYQSSAGGEVRPIEGNVGAESNQKPFIFAKPQSEKRPDFNTVQFGQPSKVENHFISVSPGGDNPSYSLQTSFSIGVPPPDQKQTPPFGGSQGVGQVLFPDEEPEKSPAVPTWPQQRPPQVSQSDSHTNVQAEKYPRPPWESHLKPPFIHHKKEQYPPIKRKPLPNILPQFRPNAKIGYAEPHVYLKPREPYDTLQPPPLPRPQFLRLEQDLEEPKPLVHRRNGQSSGTRVTTLQMMQAAPSSKRPALRIDDANEKNEPVFVVYPSNGNGAALPSEGAGDGVVVGTRGPQRPLPPDNLDIEDDLDSFPLDNNKNFQARVDTPVLKSKPSTPKPLIKNEFPYPLIKPIPEERIITPESVNTKEYTAFTPTLPSTEKDNDAEINIIPYLQDYMPFATKKPAAKEPWIFGADVKLNSAPAKQPNIEVTPATHKADNHRDVSEGPQPQDFQAPFHASLTAPSQGWSVVQKKPNNENNNEELTTNKEQNEIQTTEEPKFDIQNFKPQLIGGFKPIVPLIDKEKDDS